MLNIIFSHISNLLKQFQKHDSLGPWTESYWLHTLRYHPQTLESEISLLH